MSDNILVCKTQIVKFVVSLVLSFVISFYFTFGFDNIGLLYVWLFDNSGLSSQIKLLLYAGL